MAMMSDAEHYVITVERNSAEAQKIVQTAAAKLENHQTALIDVVQSLGRYINDDSLLLRSRAINFLTQLIGALPRSFLSRQQIHVLGQFLCDRIEDDGAINGLETLLELPRCTTEIPIMTFRAIAGHFMDFQAFAQSRRFQILTLLNTLIRNWRQTIQGLGREAIAAIVNIVAGEKDPRNLMVIFSILRVIIFEWDIRDHAEALFDTIFCYFPITFRPPPNDPYGISAQDLKVCLRDCIAASPFLAPYAFPQLMEKLDTASPNIKKDVLDTITACADNYDVSTVSRFSVALWDGLKYEIFNAQDNALVPQVLDTLKSLTRCMSGGLGDAMDNDYLSNYLQPVIKECNERLQEPQHKQAQPAAQVVKACAESTLLSFDIIIKGVVPALITLFQDSGTIERRRATLEPILEILRTSTHLHWISRGIDSKAPLSILKDQLFAMFCQALMSTPPEEKSFRLLAIDCMSISCIVPHFLSNGEIGIVVQYMDEILSAGLRNGDEACTSAAVDCLVQVSKVRPSLITDITLPSLMARLPEQYSDDVFYVDILESLARLSVDRDIASTIIRRLLHRLDIVTTWDDGAVAYARAILSTLIHILSRQNLSNETFMDIVYPKTLGLVLRCADGSTGGGNTNVLNEIPVMEMIGRLASLVVRASDSHRQHTAGIQAYSLFCPGLEETDIWTIEMSEAQRGTILLSTYLIAAVGPNVPLPFPTKDQPRVFDKLIYLAINESNPLICRSILQHLALLVNKFITLDHLEFVLDMLLAPSGGLLDPSLLSRSRLRVGFWIGKALILRLVHAERILTRLLEQIEHVELGRDAAYAFSIVLANDEIIAKDNGAAIRPLAAQRVFQITVSVMAQKFQQTDATVKPNYLIALSNILKHINADIVKLETARLLPLLMQSLDLSHQEVKAAAIGTLTALTIEDPPAIEDHVSSLIHRLLSTAEGPTKNSQIVRYNALHCLRRIPTCVGNGKLLPYRRSVSRSLQRLLDDPRREVRKEAVDCKAAWLNLDEPDEPD